MKLYKDLAEYYFYIENKTRNIQNDISLLKPFLPKMIASTILDLGCGTGEHIAELNKIGNKCIGLDNSNEMIEVAKKRCTSDIRFIVSDMTEFDLYEEIDLVYSFFGSFDYLISDEQIEKALWNTWRSLKPESYFVLEVWNALPLIEIKEKPLSEVSTTYFNGRKIIRDRGYLLKSVDPTIVNVRYNYKLSHAGSSEYIEDFHTMRAFKENEITKLLDKNGFVVKNIYANNQKEKIHPTSNKLLIVSQKC